MKRSFITQIWTLLRKPKKNAYLFFDSILFCLSRKPSGFISCKLKRATAGIFSLRRRMSTLSTLGARGFFFFRSQAAIVIAASLQTKSPLAPRVYAEHQNKRNWIFCAWVRFSEFSITLCLFFGVLRNVIHKWPQSIDLVSTVRYWWSSYWNK